MNNWEITLSEQKVSSNAKLILEPNRVSRTINTRFKTANEDIYRETKRWIPTATYATMRSYRRRGKDSKFQYTTINWMDNDKYDSGGRYTYTKSRNVKNKNKHHWHEKGATYATQKMKRKGLLE